MEIYQILKEIFDKPDAPKAYRLLADFYLDQNRIHEHDAIKNLLKIRFYESTDNDKYISEE